MIEIARSGTAFQVLFCNNNIECQRFHKKLEQLYKKGSLETVISTLQNLVKRQENEKIKAIYGSGSYSLSNQYSKFKTDLVKWRSTPGNYRMKHVKKLGMYKPTHDDEYVNPKKCGKKPSDAGKRIPIITKQKWL